MTEEQAFIMVQDMKGKLQDIIASGFYTKEDLIEEIENLEDAGA